MKVPLAILLMAASPALCWTSSDLNPSAIESVRISINDNAVDGCWTNSGEVLRYAVDQLRLHGFNVIDSKDAAFVFSIDVVGFMAKNKARDHDIGCAIYVATELFAAGDIYGMFATAQVHQDGTIMVGGDNKNREILNFVRQSIGSLDQ